MIPQLPQNLLQLEGGQHVLYEDAGLDGSHLQPQLLLRPDKNLPPERGLTGVLQLTGNIWKMKISKETFNFFA